MKGPSVSRHTSAERARPACEPSGRARSAEVCRVVRSTIACPDADVLVQPSIRAHRELSISLDQVGDHSQNDHATVMENNRPTNLERTSPTSVPVVKHVIAQG